MASALFLSDIDHGLCSPVYSLIDPVIALGTVRRAMALVYFCQLALYINSLDAMKGPSQTTHILPQCVVRPCPRTGHTHGASPPPLLP